MHRSVRLPAVVWRQPSAGPPRCGWAVQENLCYVSILLLTCDMAIVKCVVYLHFVKDCRFSFCVYIHTNSVDRECERKSQDLETVVEGCGFGD